LRLIFSFKKHTNDFLEKILIFKFVNEIQFPPENFQITSFGVSALHRYIFEPTTSVMDTLSILELILLPLSLIVFVIKTIHFLKKIRRKRLWYWFYFDYESIIISHTPESAKAKKLQNTFSALLLTLAILYIIVTLLKKISLA